MLYLIIIIVSLALSFFFSGSETAFVSVNRVRTEVWQRRKIRGADLISRFIKQPERFLYTTLIGNNIFNVAFATFATIYFGKIFPDEAVWGGIVVTTLLIGEIIPKTAFRSTADQAVRIIVYPLELFYWLLWPLYWFIRHIADLFLKLFGQRTAQQRTLFSAQDIEHLLAESANMADELASGKNADEKTDLLQGILWLKKNWVREAMVSRTEIVALPETSSVEDVVAVFRKHGFTKLPVYRENLDDITGVVYARDMIHEPEDFPALVREVMFVPETKRCSELLSEFRQNTVSIAIVIDEYGGTAGLVTTEDLVEELFGEIEDEHDEPDRWVRKLGDNMYSVSARIEIEKLNEILNLEIPEGDYQTLAGYLISLSGNIPRRDAQLQHKGIRFHITRASRRRVEWVKIILPTVTNDTR